MIIRFEGLTAGLNGSDGLMRKHYHAAKQVKNALTFEALSQRPAGHNALTGPLIVRFTRYCHRHMDWDNAASSFKHVGDSLVAAGIIADDSPKVIAVFEPRQVLVPKKEKTYMTVEILEYETV